MLKILGVDEGVEVEDLEELEIEESKLKGVRCGRVDSCKAYAMFRKEFECVSKRILIAICENGI